MSVLDGLFLPEETVRLEAVKQSVRGADVFRRVVGELTDSC
jgi:hypothetical protein